MLPIWNVTKLPKGQLGIECPRKDCQGKATVNRQKWLKGEAISEPTTKSRACTYCFRAARVPES